MSLDIHQLVNGFAEHIVELKSPRTNEATVRNRYIDPFWKLLGWDVNDEQQRGPAEAEVIVEKNLDTVEGKRFRSRRPDYFFRLNGFSRFIVEAKKPFIDLDRDLDAIFQAKMYAWNAMIPFAILTDFEQFRLYDTTLQPVLDSPDRGKINDFAIDYGNYPALWDVLLETFGREAVATGSLEDLRRRQRKTKSNRRIRGVDRMLIDLRGEEPVDRVFLEFLDKYRKRFADAIYRQNKRDFPEADTIHGAARLTETVQRLMDRLVFMRVCEDRDIAPWGQLRELLDRVANEGGNLYEELRSAFRRLDREYNGYLFKPHDLEAIKVDNEVLAAFVRELYPPDGSWQFDAISDDILGIVYERFLGNTIEVHRGRVVIEPKPAYERAAKKTRHKTGVYYTPRFVVDSIVRRVVGEKVKNLAPLDILSVKILDPACGSGSFLVAALEYLFKHCESAIHADPTLATLSVPAIAGAGKGRRKRAEIAFRGEDGQWYLAPDFRAAILTSCVHGVDIDQQAVEVTVMSLYLKMLESKLPRNWQKDWVENRLLPPLERNIQCGNSLIDEASYDDFLLTKPGVLYGEDKDTAFRINRFDWHGKVRGFYHVLGPRPKAAKTTRRGFDCIIGNPPYIRVQELRQWAPEEADYYRWMYASAKKGNFDIYVVFTEKGLSLLAPDGLLGFIMPHKFWQARYGEGLRKVIAQGNHLRAVVDFGDQQVFKGATTYTAIHILARAPSSADVDYAKVEELDDGLAQCSDLDAGRNAQGAKRFMARKPQDDAAWVFSNIPDSEWLDAVRANHQTLGEISSRIAQGLVSGCDPTFYVERRGSEYFSHQTGRSHPIEDDVLHPLLKGSLHVRRWAVEQSPLRVLFPYELESGEWKLIEPGVMEAKYPLAFDYLKNCRQPLIEREKKHRKNERGELIRGPDGKPEYNRPFDSPQFYRFSRPQNFHIMPLAKLLVPAMAKHAEYAIDDRGAFFFVGSGGGGGGAYAIVPSIDVSLEYLCGLLNSTVCDAFLQRVSTPFHSGWFAYSKAFVEQIPIKLPETAAEKMLAERIELSVRAIMDAKMSLQDSNRRSERERRQLESTIETHEQRIDEAVFQLYGIDSVPE